MARADTATSTIMTTIMSMSMSMSMSMITTTHKTISMAGMTTITIDPPLSPDSPLSPEHLQRLATWFSPSFPIGGFSYSHGLEAAFEAGLVTDRAALTEWLQGLLAFGSARNDAILFCEAYRAAPTIAEVAEIAAALSPSAELRAETLNQGEAFLRAIAQGWPALAPANPPQEMALPVATGLVCASADIPLGASLLAYLHAFAANVVSAALRSMPIGQSDGLKVQASLEAQITETAAAARALSLDDLGAATPMLDWLSATHETQYSRLFRS